MAIPKVQTTLNLLLEIIILDVKESNIDSGQTRADKHKNQIYILYNNKFHSDQKLNMKFTQINVLIPHGSNHPIERFYNLTQYFMGLNLSI